MARRSGTTPVEPLELEQGEHVVRVESPRHDPFSPIVTIEGGGSEQTLSVTLVPRYRVDRFPVEAGGGPRDRRRDETVGTTPRTSNCSPAAMTTR